MVRTSTFGQRILRLVDAVGSRRGFARLIGNSDAAVMMWESGSNPYQKTMDRIAERTGVSLAWLRDGRGEDDKEVQKFRERLNIYGETVTESVVREEPSLTSEQMECPLHLPPANSAELALDHAAGQMDSQSIASLIQKTVRDERIEKNDRYRMAKRLAALLVHKLADEAPSDHHPHGKS
jgi:transcriptional regulator with XRE-family HTH domain